MMEKIFILIAIMLLVNIGFVSAQSVPSSGLIAHYPFDNNVNDVSGNGWTPNIIGSPSYTIDRNGNANSAINLDGVDDYLEVIDGPIDQHIPNGISGAAWVKLDNISKINRVWSRPWSNFELRYTGGGYSCAVKANQTSGSPPYAGFFPVSESEWHHIGCTYNPSDDLIRLYVDGVQVRNRQANFVDDFLSHSDGSDMTFGAAPNPAEHFQGQIDDLVFYGRTLTQQEITDMYNYVPSEEICGNSIVEGSEECDSGVGSNTCVSINQGFDGGSLGCVAQGLQNECSFDTSQCSLPATTECSDNVDNDGDGLIDLDDVGCFDSNDNDETNIIGPSAQCSDGIDNDEDGFIDLEDVGCFDSNDNDETDEDPVINNTQTNKKPEQCQPTWDCSDWENLEQRCGRRACRDLNDCGVLTGKPRETIECPLLGTAPQEDFCGDGVCSIGESSIICSADCEGKGSLKFNPSVLFWIIVGLVGISIAAFVVILIKRIVYAKSIKGSS